MIFVGLREGLVYIDDGPIVGTGQWHLRVASL